MEFPQPKLIIEGKEYEIISLDDFRERRGLPNLSNQSISNHMDKGTLDYTTLGRFRYIVWNRKAKDFNLCYVKKSFAG